MSVPYSILWEPGEAGAHSGSQRQLDVELGGVWGTPPGSKSLPVPSPLCLSHSGR